MFGISLWEMGIVALVAVVVVGPQKLPSMLRTLGLWIHRLRRMTTDVREQTGIDDILRQEGIEGGLTGLRGMMRGDLSAIGRFADQYGPGGAPYTASRVAAAGAVATVPNVHQGPLPDARGQVDRDREYPFEGADVGDVIPDDLLASDDEPAGDGEQQRRDAAGDQRDSAEDHRDSAEDHREDAAGDHRDSAEDHREDAAGDQRDSAEDEARAEGAEDDPPPAAGKPAAGGAAAPPDAAPPDKASGATS